MSFNVMIAKYYPFRYEVQQLEEIALHKSPKKGKCENSCFANGNHRVGLIPLVSVLDNGAAGDVAIDICLECGKPFPKKSWFVLKNQPRTIGDSSYINKN